MVITRPTSIPADAAPFDQAVADRVPRYGTKGEKTTGVLALPDGRMLAPQDSGYTGPTSRMPTPRRGMDMYLMAHVEAHAVASMREHNVTSATLYINKMPCQYTGPRGRPWGCERALPHMLRPDETLTVYGPGGYARVLSGVAHMNTREETAVPERVLVDGLGYELTPQSEDELVRGLAEIDAPARERGEPVLVTLYANATDDAPPSLGIGLGAEGSVLVYDAGNWGGEGGFSKGPRTGDMTEVGFRYGTAVNEYLGWMLIPKEAAFAAALEFFRTGQRPTTVEWGTI